MLALGRKFGESLILSKGTARLIIRFVRTNDASAVRLVISGEFKVQRTLRPCEFTDFEFCGHTVELSIDKVCANTVKLGIEAPRSITIIREDYVNA